MTFEAPAGTTTALVGSSGAGKSTVISLVMGFRHPGSGRVMVDGHDLRDVRMPDYRRQLAVVLQDDFLFDGTIAENIAYGKPGATLPEIERAGQLAHCDEFIGQFELGYDTVIGERGVKLSGGQRQRVSIARAMLADPRILILDEATSSLDSENELVIQEGFKRLKEGRTTFVIAHRLSTIRNADQILVMEDGEIVERGTHDELLAAAGRYRELYDKQYNLRSTSSSTPERTSRRSSRRRLALLAEGRPPACRATDRLNAAWRAGFSRNGYAVRQTAGSSSAKRVRAPSSSIQVLTSRAGVTSK